MCDCIKNLEEKLIGTTQKGGKVIKAQFVSAALFPFSNEGIKCVSEMEFQVEGRKGKVKQSVINNYCPFCGVKYIKKSEAKSVG